MLPVWTITSPIALVSAETFSQLPVKAAAAAPCQPASPTIRLTFLFRAVITSSLLGTDPYSVPANAARPWMSPPTHSWANGASGARAFVGRVAVAATALPSVDLGWGADLVAELSQAFLGVGVVVVRLLQLGRIDLHDPGGLQVQGADHLGHDLEVLVECAVSAVWARRGPAPHGRPA